MTPAKRKPDGVRGLRPMRRRPRHLESAEQRLFVQRWRMDPRTRNLPACAVPNGGLRTPREAVILKAEGVEAGVPDWLCLCPHGPYSGLAIEFKSPTGKGRITEHQARWHLMLRGAGWHVIVATSAQDAWDAVKSYFEWTYG